MYEKPTDPEGITWHVARGTATSKTSASDLIVVTGVFFFRALIFSFPFQVRAAQVSAGLIRHRIRTRASRWGEAQKVGLQPRLAQALVPRGPHPREYVLIQRTRTLPPLKTRRLSSAARGEWALIVSLIITELARDLHRVRDCLGAGEGTFFFWPTAWDTPYRSGCHFPIFGTFPVGSAEHLLYYCT